MLALSSLMLRGGGCGSDIGDKGAGEPCTRGGECEEGLICGGGVCRQPDGGAGSPDAA